MKQELFSLFFNYFKNKIIPPDQEVICLVFEQIK